MMFTLGYKEAIVNPGVYTVKTKASATAAADANFTSGSDILVIQKFGTFSKAAIKSSTAARYVGPVLSTLSFTAPAAAELGVVTGEVNKLVKVHIRFTTSRYASEWATDFIRRGRPFMVQIRVNAGETADQVAVKVEAAIAEQATSFKNAVFPFTVGSHVSNKVSLVAATGDITFSNEVEFLLSGTSYGWKAVTVAVVAGAEAVNSGKWLEENVRIGTDVATEIYGIKAQDLPVIGGKYTSFSWVSKVTDQETTATGVIDEAGVTKENKFTIYVNEADFTMVTNIATWLSGATNANPFTTGTWSTVTGANAATSNLAGTLAAFLA